MTSEIQDFFAQKSIFVTGGTGFLGKLLIEKLLRCCPSLDSIFVLVRHKKNKMANQRMDEFVNDHVGFFKNHH